MYSDFRSTCPIRRVRQKLGINSLNRIMDSVLLGNIEPCSSTVKKGFQDLSQNQCPHSLDAREETEGNKILNKVASGSVQSREMESKIMQGLDKLLPSPKRKSMKLKDNPVEESPSYGIHTNPKGEALIGLTIQHKIVQIIFLFVQLQVLSMLYVIKKEGLLCFRRMTHQLPPCMIIMLWMLESQITLLFLRIRNQLLRLENLRYKSSYCVIAEHFVTLINLYI